MIHITMMTADILEETKLYVLEKRGEMEVTRVGQFADNMINKYVLGIEISAKMLG